MRGMALALAGIVGVMTLAVMASVPSAWARSEAELARDRDVIRQLNRDELARVRRRDAQFAAQARGSGGSDGAYTQRRADYERGMERYAQDKRLYQRRMAAWRRAVAACQAGDYLACDN
jgi:hypothetical protein